MVQKTKNIHQLEIPCWSTKGQWKPATLFVADKKATVTQIITLYNSGEQKNISES